MNVTSTGLARAAGAAAATAGAIFVAVQVNHPAETAFDTETTEWVLRCTAKGVMAVLALVGITGMYLRQHRQAGLLGLVGYALIKLDFEPAPLLLGFVLGPMLEENLRRAMLLSRGDPVVFIERPISATMLAIALVALAAMLMPNIRKGKDTALAEGG